MSSAMSISIDSSIPSDVTLLLRADAEQRWLYREVVPVLRHLEARDALPSDQVGPALAYLETSWSEAMVRARATDAAHARLDAIEDEGAPLAHSAARYHTAVRALRGIVTERVAPFVDAADGEPEPARSGLRVQDMRGPARLHADDCEHRAA